jgi:hypothetical protein
MGIHKRDATRKKFVFHCDRCWREFGTMKKAKKHVDKNDCKPYEPEIQIQTDSNGMLTGEGIRFK